MLVGETFRQRADLTVRGFGHRFRYDCRHPAPVPGQVYDCARLRRRDDLGEAFSGLADR